MHGQAQPQLALGHQPGGQRGNRHALAAGFATTAILGAHDLAKDQFGRQVVVLGCDFLADPLSFLAAGRADFIGGFQDHLLFFQLDRRQVAASPLPGALMLLSFLLGQGFFEHFPAKRGRTLVLLLRVPQQLPQLPFLFRIELVGFGPEELAPQIGQDRLSFSQLPGLLSEFLLRGRQLALERSGIRRQPGRIIGKLAQ